MSDATFLESDEISPFRRYFLVIRGLRDKDNPGARRAINMAGGHRSWTDEALDPQREFTWMTLVEKVTQMVTDPGLESGKKQRLQDKLNEFEVFVDLKKPTTDRDNKRRLQELLAVVRN